MFAIKVNAPDVKTLPEWRAYAKAMAWRCGYLQAAKHYAACHGSAVIHRADDSATILWREEGLASLCVKSKTHRNVAWIV